MLRHIAVDDCGRILNPLLVSGQQHGGIAQGAAQALYEWVRYDDDGNPMTSTLMDYTMPSAAELPQLRDVEHADRQPEKSARRERHRRVGHHWLDASDPERCRRCAVHLGVIHIDMPCTPERVWKRQIQARVEGKPHAPIDGARFGGPVVIVQPSRNDHRQLCHRGKSFNGKSFPSAAAGMRVRCVGCARASTRPRCSSSGGTYMAKRPR